MSIHFNFTKPINPAFVSQNLSLFTPINHFWNVRFDRYLNMEIDGIKFRLGLGQTRSSFWLSWQYRLNSCGIKVLVSFRLYNFSILSIYLFSAVFPQMRFILLGIKLTEYYHNLLLLNQWIYINNNLHLSI